MRWSERTRSDCGPAGWGEGLNNSFASFVKAVETKVPLLASRLFRAESRILVMSFLPPRVRPVLAALALAGLAAPSPAADYPERLVNLSSRAMAGEGDAALIAGFAIAPGPDKLVLVRAIGPTLANYGVAGVVANPRLVLFNAAGEIIATNEDWSEVNAAVFAAVGAFGLPNGSRDAALVATLPSGTYTAQLQGGSGAGLVEIYDVTGAARLTNLSTRARVEADRSLVISGLVVSSNGGARRLLIRAIGPTLGEYGVNGALGDPAVAIVRASDGVQLATNNDWAGDGDPVVLEQAFQTGGAFPLPRTSLDSAVVMELTAGVYTVLVSGANGTQGPALVEIYDLTPTEGSLVSAAAAVATTESKAGSTPGKFTFTRAGQIDEAITVNFTISGTAVSGADFAVLPTSVVIPAGSASASLDVIPALESPSSDLAKTVTIKVLPGEGYAPGASDTATVTIFFTPGQLYVANLRPLDTAGVSTGYGTATLQLSKDESRVIINMSFANLSSPQTVAYVRLGQPGDAGPYLYRLDAGQVSNLDRSIDATGELSQADIVTALKEGRLYVSIETATNPTGELVGSFVRSSGSQLFTPPNAPPAVSLAVDSDTAAARFLMQATFGPRLADIAEVKTMGIEAWVTAQMAKPISSHRDLTMEEFARDPTGGRNMNARPGTVHRDSAWWKIAINGEDQLRQRVAFALSEILVVSVENAVLNNWQEGVAHYYDQLAAHAFGNYRDLLETVTRSPIMGIYLSHMSNAKADPETGSVPDENYAREVMQLFSIGLNELQPDGTLKLNPSGLPIATYNNTTIQEMAKIFTGWAFASDNTANPNLFRRNRPEYILPMSLFPDFHEPGPKTIVSGIQVPAGQGGEADLRLTLDALFEHPNTGPFIARRLIQRLVTSNPTPGYVYRVAQKFANNGAGVRGDLGAVVRAILTDYEARSVEVAAVPSFGKLREPLLRMTNLFRVAPASAADGRLDLRNLDRDFGQQPLGALSVFNFFEPDFVRPGPLAAAGLYAPEFQVLTDTTAITGTNVIYAHLFAAPAGVSADVTPLLGLADDVDALVARLNLLFAANRLSETSLAQLKGAYAAFPSGMSARLKVQNMVYLTLLAPEATVQR